MLFAGAISYANPGVERGRLGGLPDVFADCRQCTKKLQICRLLGLQAHDNVRHPAGLSGH